MPTATCSRVHDGLSSSRLQHFGEVRLHEDHRREVIAGSELELRLIPAREAVVAAVRAAAIRVERPVEGHALDGIERGPAGHFLVARGVRAPLRLVEGRVLASVTDPERQRPRRGGLPSKVEEEWAIRPFPSQIRFYFAR